MPQVSQVMHRAYPQWLHFCSVGLLAFSVGLLLLSLFVHNRDTVVSASLVPALLVALGFAGFLNFYSLWHLRREHEETDKAFRDADCEFGSVFRNVLDSVLIVDSDGNCLDANPAAADILKVPIDKVIAHHIGRFVPGCVDFKKALCSLIQSGNRRRTLKLVAGDGTILFAEVAVTNDYLPGRHVLILCDVTGRTRAEIALRESEQRFRQMADYIQEIFWIVDADTRGVIYVNSACSTITGYSLENLLQNPTSYRNLIHSDDRIRIVSRLQDFAQQGTFDEEFRFVHADGDTRWARAKGTLVVGKKGKRWLVGTAQDITSRKRAEMKITEQLDLVDAARSEAEALRKATQALSRNLAMDSVLDTLLQCMFDLIPYDRATVLFLEDGAELMVAREAPSNVPKRIGLTLTSSSSVFIQRILYEKQAVLLSHTSKHADWQDIQPFERVQSWLGIPLIAGEHVLGILSLGADTPATFTAEHLRLAKSLAIPATLAIQNARIHERAEIYAAALEMRLEELREAQNALQRPSRRH